MAEIRDFIENDDALLSCKNHKLRHAYAKKIAEQYTEQSEIQIFIGDVEAVADELYEKLR